MVGCVCLCQVMDCINMLLHNVSFKHVNVACRYSDCFNLIGLLLYCLWDNFMFDLVVMCLFLVFLHLFVVILCLFLVTVTIFIIFVS